MKPRVLLTPSEVAQELGVSMRGVHEMARHMSGLIWSPIPGDDDFRVPARHLDYWRSHLRREPQPRTVVRTRPGGPETTLTPHA